MSIATLIKTSCLSVACMSMLGKETHSNNVIKGFGCTLVRGVLINTKHFYVFLIFVSLDYLKKKNIFLSVSFYDRVSPGLRETHYGNDADLRSAREDEISK